MSTLSGRLWEVVAYQRSGNRGSKFWGFVYSNCGDVGLLPVLSKSVVIPFSSHKDINTGPKYPRQKVKVSVVIRILSASHKETAFFSVLLQAQNKMSRLLDNPGDVTVSPHFFFSDE